MEANMSLLKRRLNKAMLECRWQASCTARRLAGRMQRERDRGQAAGAGQVRRHFSYSFQQAAAAETVGRGPLTRTMGNKANFGDQVEEEQEQQQVVEEFSSDDSQDQRRPSQKMSPVGGHFVRSSALSGSRRHSHHRGSSRRRRSHRAARQVRFQPIPQSIGDHHHHDDGAQRRPSEANNSAKYPKTRAARLGQLQMRIQVAHKPLARRLQHLKLARIKLKSFNTIAQQLHQTLAPSSSTFAPSSAQQQQQQPQQAPIGNDQADDDYGWGSDFDEQSLESGSGEQQTANSYLLEIGRPSDDQRAIDDVIQDRGISGQFKRLEVGAGEAQQVPPQQAPAPGSEASVERGQEQAQEEEEEEDEEELRSLEARQGFRQLKDKLKVILDQRLADYERSASASSGATCEPATRASADSEPQGSGQPHVASPGKAPTPSKADVQDDCHSHCSDDSSLASNHSGSQDSGHSTQHSGYSAHCPLHHHHHHQHQHHPHQPPGSLEAPSSSETDSTQTQPRPTQVPAPTKPPGDHCDERRSRFLQNRLIINSKLESMFQQRAPASMVSLSEGCERRIAAAGSGQVQRSQTMAARSQPAPARAKAEASSTQVDPETRSRLLEQQRQMSLKLKQKPRRRTTAARASRQPGEAKPEAEQHDELGSYARARDSLTKQLSMVCLKGGQGAPAHHQDGPSHPGGHPPLSMQARPARSLRQLVTEVIDDCERPSKLSTLTMSILNRSDSSSSDLAASADDLSASSPLRQPARPDTGGAPHHHQQSPDPKRLAPASPYQLHHQLRLAASNAANLSATSSVGSTIDGLEYSPLKDEESVVVPAEVGGAQKSHTKLGSYLKSLRDFSKFKLPKVRLDGIRLGSSNNSYNNNPISTTTERPPVEPRLAAGARQHLNAHSTLAGAWRRRYQPTNAPGKPSASQLGSAASVLGHGGEAFANHFVTISNRKWKSCHLRTSLMQVAFNSPSGATNTGASSPVCASKQHLAYLDNSKNFTDDDNY